MEEYLFYFIVTAGLMVLHQVIAYAILGEFPLKMAAAGAAGALGERMARSMVMFSLIGGAFVQPFIWMVLPTWLMVAQAIVGEVVAIRHLLKMRRLQQQ